ncbi:MAG TPA: hypothetical protein VLT45_17850 [Kofleriaceae bacterium]|nr:hypothetical protein [Kofleriaceae bacterium]
MVRLREQREGVGGVGWACVTGLAKRGPGTKIALVALAVAACQGGSSDAPKPLQGSAHAGAKGSVKGSAQGSGATAGSAQASASDAGGDAPDDPNKVIDDLRAVPAWQAVVDRTLYLARRGQHGVVYGTLGAPIPLPPPPPGTGSASTAAAGSGAAAGSAAAAAAAGSAAVPPASPYTWLVDDTEGNGALAIRVELGKYALETKTGDRVALGGAWALDDTKHYYWKVDALQALRPAKPIDSKDSPLPPGHVITTGDFPAGVKRISLAKEGDAAYFTVVGAPPTVDGDGWPVADELGNPVVGLLVLPGERASYGAQDMRTPDERWQLKRGQTYWVRISRFHKRGADKPPAIIARTPPVWVR